MKWGKTAYRKGAALAIVFAVLVSLAGGLSAHGAEPNPDAWDGSSVDTGWYDTASTDFYLTTPAQLAGLAAIVNGTATGIGRDDFSGKTVTLDDDLDLGSNPWTPIGNLPITVTDSGASYSTTAEGCAPFSGTFEGGGHAIRNLYISGTASGAALFGYTGRSCSIKNLTVDGSVSGAYFVGGIVAVGGGSLEGLVSGVTVSATNDYVGGILAEGLDGLKITGCRNQGQVSNSSNTRSSGRVAGIVGRVETGASAAISRCANTADIRGYQYVAGIIGGQYGNADVEYCYNTGNITGVSFGKVYLGGISGKCEGGTISNCYNTGNLYDEHWAAGHIRAIGGIAGCEEDRLAGTAITNCYTTGTIGMNTANMTYGENWIYEVGNISGGNSPTANNTMSYENCFYLGGRIAIADPSNESYKFWADIYKADKLIWDTASITGVTEEELKDSGFLSRIGSAFVQDTGNLNGGYPVLFWQADGQETPQEYNVTASGYGSESAVVSLSASRATAGTTITVSITGVEAGRQVKSVLAKDAAGNVLTVADAGGGSYTFTMPKRNVTVEVRFENTVDPEAGSYNLIFPEGLDAIWTVSAESTYLSGSAVKAGATVTLTVSKDSDAAMTSLEGVSLTAGGGAVTADTYRFDRDSSGSGYQGVYVFTMPAADVTIAPEITYADFTIYTKTGSGDPVAVKTLTRADMLALAKDNLYYSGYYSETEPFIGKAAQGVTLTDLLTSAGLAMEPGDSLEVTAADGMNLYFSYDKLYGSQRYYYPNLITGGTAEEKAAGKTPVDAMFVVKGNMAIGGGTAVDSLVCDTRYAYRFVFGQTETEFNNGVPAVQYKVIDELPKYANSLTMILPEETLLGDINGDGRISTMDAVCLAKYLVGDLTLTAAQLEAADVTGDGRVSTMDAVYLAKYLVGDISAF